MKERPIAYSPPMVRARRAGLKTQTRRIVKGGDQWPANAVRVTLLESRGTAMAVDVKRCTYGPEIKNPYGQPGDRLWVKEEHYLFGIWRIDGKRANGKPKYRFEVDKAMGAQFDQAPNSPITGRNTEVPGWYKRIGMFMPRWASRSLDEIVSVRVERLQDISEAEAIAEGSQWAACGAPQEGSHKAGYAQLWESINGPGSWDSNPWVWVVEFKVVTS